MSRPIGVVTCDPFRCRMWELHDRLEHHLDESSCKSEIESIAKHGQLVPALGRHLRNDSSHDVELIYGARRLFIARHLNKPLLVDVREVTDLEGIVAMDIENRHRRDISPYERGISYARWLRSGFFGSQDDIARSLKISPSQVSRLLKLARLPAAIVSAFPTPIDICETWAHQLSNILDDSGSKERTCARARQLARSPERRPAREVYRQLLMAAKPGRKAKRSWHDEVVKGGNGEPLFRIRHNLDHVSFLFSAARIPSDMVPQLQAAIVKLLDSGTPETCVLMPKVGKDSLPDASGATCEDRILAEHHA